MKAVLTLRGTRGPEIPTRLSGANAWAGRVAGAGRRHPLNFHDIFTRRGMPSQIKLPVIVGFRYRGNGRIARARRGRTLGRQARVDRSVMRDGDRFGMLGETVDAGRAELVVVRPSMLLEIPAGGRFRASSRRCRCIRHRLSDDDNAGKAQGRRTSWCSAPAAARRRRLRAARADGRGRSARFRKQPGENAPAQRDWRQPRCQLCRETLSRHCQDLRQASGYR